jgi:outer membrane protein assembly factor BamA
MAQKTVRLIFINTQHGNNLLKEYKIANQLVDSASVSKEINQALLQLHAKEYLLASIDSTWTKPDSVCVRLYIGERFRWINLRRGNVDEVILNHSGFREKLYRDKPFSYSELATQEDNVLTYCENQGFPFATIRLDSISITPQGIQASLFLEKGTYIRFDTIHLEGSVSLKKRFLYAIIRAHPGQPYSQVKLDKAQQQLRQFPYLSLSQPYSVLFKNDRAYPVFYAQSRRANEIDGIIGFQPNEQTSNKLLVTGELNLKIRNLLSSGKNFFLRWQQIKPGSPRLNFTYEHPYFLGTPFEAKVDFNLLREDTSFVTVNRQLSVGYVNTNGGKLSFTTGLRTSALGKNASYRTSEQLPDYADYRYMYYGLGYTWNNLNNYFYPRRGLELAVDFSVGNKKIVKNPFLKQELYDTIDLSTVQLTIKADLRKYTALTSRACLLFQVKGGMISNQNLFLNDLYRLGGINTLRGFNENFFYASDYGIGTFEYRFFLEEQSFLFLFYDQAYLKYKIQNRYFEDGPLGTGAGINFKTNAGVFTLAYAVGNSKERKFGLNYSKIHFGLVSRF